MSLRFFHTFQNNSVANQAVVSKAMRYWDGRDSTISGIGTGVRLNTGPVNSSVSQTGFDATNLAEVDASNQGHICPVDLYSAGTHNCFAYADFDIGLGIRFAGSPPTTGAVMGFAISSIAKQYIPPETSWFVGVRYTRPSGLAPSAPDAAPFGYLTGPPGTVTSTIPQSIVRGSDWAEIGFPQYVTFEIDFVRAGVWTLRTTINTGTGREVVVSTHTDVPNTNPHGPIPWIGVSPMATPTTPGVGLGSIFITDVYVATKTDGGLATPLKAGWGIVKGEIDDSETDYREWVGDAAMSMRTQKGWENRGVAWYQKDPRAMALYPSHTRLFPNLPHPGEFVMPTTRPASLIWRSKFVKSDVEASVGVITAVMASQYESMSKTNQTDRRNYEPWKASVRHTATGPYTPLASTTYQSVSTADRDAQGMAKTVIVVDRFKAQYSAADLDSVRHEFSNISS